MSYSNTQFAHGDCYYYAYCMSEILNHLNQPHEIYSYFRSDLKSGHCFIKYNGKFFDSENVYSPVENHRQLQGYMKKTRNLIKHRNRNSALKHWKAKDQKEAFDKVIPKFLKELK
jgi:hypothetical protein